MPAALPPALGAGGGTAAPGAGAGAVQRGRVPDTTGGSTAAYKEHLPHPSSSRRTQDAAPTANTKPRELGRAVYGNLPTAKSFNFSLFFFFPSFSPFKNYLFHVRWSHGVPPLPLCPRAHPGRWDGVRFSLRGAFCFHDHTNCNKLYKKNTGESQGLAATFFCMGQGQEALPSPPPPSYMSFGLFFFRTGSFRSLFTSCFLHCFFDPGFASCFLQNSK